MFGNITPNCRSASACSLKVSLASELLLTRSWHHRGSGVTPPSHLSNEYFDKFVRWRERHINLSDHNLRDKAFKFGVGELRTTLCTCRPLDHFTCEPLCHLCPLCHMCHSVSPVPPSHPQTLPPVPPPSHPTSICVTLPHIDCSGRSSLCCDQCSASVSSTYQRSVTQFWISILSASPDRHRASAETCDL